MTPKRLWDPCVAHRGAEAVRFVQDFFSDAGRKILLIAGAGFDPRSTHVSKALAAVAHDRMMGTFIREERPDPDLALVQRAEANLSEMITLAANSTQLSVQVFAPDGAVV